MTLPVSSSSSTSSASAAAAAAAARQRALEAARRAEEARRRAAEAARAAKAAAKQAQEAIKAASAQKKEVTALKTQLASTKPAQKPTVEKQLAEATRKLETLESKAGTAKTKFEEAVGKAEHAGKVAVQASEEANRVAIAEGKAPPFSRAQVAKADDTFEALTTTGASAKLLGQLRNERLSRDPIFGDKNLSSEGAKQGAGRGEAVADEVLARAKAELGGELIDASPKDLNRALIKALRSTAGETSLLRDDALTGRGLDRAAQSDLATAYGHGLGEGLRDALTEALGNDAARVLKGRVGAEVQDLAQLVGKQIGERSFGPDVGGNVASASKDSAHFSKPEFLAEQASAAATTLQQATERSVTEGAAALQTLLKELPTGARADFLAKSHGTLQALGEGLASLDETQAAAVSEQLDAAIATAGKRGPEAARVIAEARIEAAAELSPEQGAEALADELERLPTSQKRELVDNLADTIEGLGKALDVASEQKSVFGQLRVQQGKEAAIDGDALRSALDRATLAAGAAGGELALQIAEARIREAAGGNKVEAAEVLRQEIENLPSVAGRAELLKRLGDTLEDIAEGAVGEIDDEAPRHDIIRDFSAVAEMSGLEGTKLLAKQFADAQADGDETHTDVDDGNQLGGAFREVLYDDDVNPAFGIALAQELDARGGVGDAAKDVAQGVYEGINDLDPSHAERIAKDAVDFLKNAGSTVLDGLDKVAEATVDVAKAAARFASDAFDFVTKPLTDAVNREIDKLGPGDDIKIAVGGGVNIRAVGVSGEAQLEIKRGEEGGYTVAIAGNIEADVAKKLKLPLTIGVDGRVEFEFDSVEDAKRAASTLAQIGTAAVAGGVIPGGSALAAGVATLANVGDGDVQFLAKNVSAVEVGTEAAADLSAKLGLPGMDPDTGTGLGVAVSSGQRARIEFGDPPSISFTQTLSGEVKAGIGTGGQGINLSGSASAEFEVHHKLTLPEDFSLTDVDNVGDLIDKTKIESGVNVTLQQQGGVKAGVGPFAAGGTGTLTANLSISGDPLRILREGVPAILDGDLTRAVKAVDKHADVTASLEFVGTGTASAKLRAAGVGVTYGEEIEARLAISGDPLAIVSDGLPELLDGDVKGAAKAVGDNVQLEAEITTRSSEVIGADVKIDAVVADVKFVAERTDLEEDTKYEYSGSATETLKELDGVWGEVA